MSDSFFAQNLDLWLSIILTMLVVSIIIGSIAIYNNNKLKKRYEKFMGINKKRTSDIDMEKLLLEAVNKAESIDDKYAKILEIIVDMQKNMKYCCQKVGIVRYNPFEEMGGNLCFAVAILDSKDTGIVINGIHSRTGTFTYAKPVELGVSTYILSKEEQEAIDKAKLNSYQASKKTVAEKNSSKKQKAKNKQASAQERREKAEIYKKAVAKKKRPVAKKEQP